MRSLSRSRLVLLALAGLSLTASPSARAQPRARPVSRAELDRLDKKLEAQQQRLDKLIELQVQYLQTLSALASGSPSPAAPEPRTPEPRTPEPRAPEPRAPEPRIDGPAVSDPRPAAGDARPKPVAAAEPKVKKPKADVVGNIVGKVTGVADAVVYVDDIVVSTHGSAAMKQENKQFSPQVLVVQKGTTVQFPNMDAIFHNVFSVTPESSFDLGNYRQGESKGVTLSKPGVVSVYCNMHPQMVGHILVVPNGNFARAGKDGFFRLSNVPAGRHRIVAWAPNAKPVATDVEVSDSDAATVELELKKGRGGTHTKKDGLPYGSYER